MRTFVMGDPHGAYKAMLQCFERSGFDKEKDMLICLGDVCDGWDEVYECVELLLSCKYLISLIGNHDEWFVRWLRTGEHPDMWSQGGKGTLESYVRYVKRDLGDEAIVSERAWTLSGPITIFKTNMTPDDIPETHREFFLKYQVLADEMISNTGERLCFVHAGFDRTKSIIKNKLTDPSDFYWDRKLWEQALSCKGDQKLTTVEGFDKIFIGHTEIYRMALGKPVYSGGVWNLDTGAGWNGVLTMMDVNTEAYWQSDMTPTLYPEQFARR